MRRSRWLQFLASLGFEFWLPLPLLGFAVWAIAGLVADRQLSQYNPYLMEFQVPQNSKPLEEQVFSIKVIVNRDRQISQIKVKQIKNTFQNHEFTLKTTNLEEVEIAISKQLGLSSKQVQELVRYQIEK